jgi:AraC-like DNA-binding protein
MDSPRILYAAHWHKRAHDPDLHIEILAHRFAKQPGLHAFTAKSGLDNVMVFHAAAELNIGRRRLAVAAGSLVVWRSSDPPGSYGNRQHPWPISWASLRGRHWEELLQSSHIPLLTPLPLADPLAATSCMLGLQRELIGHQRPDIVILLSHLRILFREALRTDQSADNATPDDHLLWARWHLDHHLSREVDLAELAAHQGISTRHLVRRFTAAWGMTPGAYHRMARAALAMRLLDQPETPLAAIARQLGYATAFARAFKKWHGASPDAYRRSRTGAMPRRGRTR